MKKAQINLKLFLDALDIPSTISTLADRKRVQKAVYIGQKATVNLGYSYGWYVHGPYSPELTQDYFALNNDLINKDCDYKNYKFNQLSSDKLKAIKDLMKVPKKVDLSQDDWLELVASIIYKRNELKNDAETKEFLMQKKSHLIAYYEEGLIHAQNYGLI